MKRTFELVPKTLPLMIAGLEWMRVDSGHSSLGGELQGYAFGDGSKVGDPDDLPYGRGPQGDAIRIYNYVRCVRTGS